MKDKINIGMIGLGGRGVGLLSLAILRMKDVDVVRHRLVKKVINAYDEYYKKNPPKEEE